MSSEAPSNENNSRNADRGRSNKRHRGTTASAPRESDGTPAVVEPEKPKAPTAAGKLKIAEFVRTLHPGMHDYLNEKLQKSFRIFTTHFNKSAKYNEMIADPSYVPRSCDWGLDLDVLQEVRQSEEFVALDAEKTVQLEACRIKMAAQPFGLQRSVAFG